MNPKTLQLLRNILTDARIIQDMPDSELKKRNVLAIFDRTDVLEIDESKVLLTGEKIPHDTFIKYIFALVDESNGIDISFFAEVAISDDDDSCDFKILLDKVPAEC